MQSEGPIRVRNEIRNRHGSELELAAPAGELHADLRALHRYAADRSVRERTRDRCGDVGKVSGDMRLRVDQSCDRRLEAEEGQPCREIDALRRRDDIAAARERIERAVSSERAAVPHCLSL